MKLIRLLPALLAVVALAGFAVAGDDAKTVTVSGKIVCAKCTMHKDDMKECQNVLVAEKDGKTVEYYIAKNEVAEDFGHVCKAEKQVTATGTIAEKDGHTWITATKLEQKS
jgi:type 1 fimbria pilin